MSPHSINAGLSTEERARSTQEKPLRTVPPYARLFSLFRSRCKRRVQWWWAWKVLATAIPIAATLSLIIVLSQADGRVQKYWTYGAAQLPINTIVALLSTVIRAALLVAVTGALSQSLWNRFSPSKGDASGPTRPLKDLDTFWWRSYRLIGKPPAAMENEGLVSRLSLTCGLSLTRSRSNLAALGFVDYIITSI